MNADRFEAFSHAYRAALETAMAAYPDDYMPGVPASIVADRMLATIQARGVRAVNKDGRAFRAVCKAFGIAHTYKAIEAYLAGEGA